MYNDKTGPKPETIKYTPHTGPSAKERAKKFLKLDTVKEVKEDASVNESAESNTSFVRQNHDEEQQHGITETQVEEDVEIPELSLPTTIGLLVLVTVLVAVTAEWLVDSIGGLADGGGISREFIGLILLPIVGNAAEHVSAVTVSIKDKLTLSISVAVGSSIVSSLLSGATQRNSFILIQQIALFVIPFTVVLGWIMGRPLTMLFDPFESIILFLAVLTVNYVVQDGKSNWLEGLILLCLCV